MNLQATAPAANALIAYALSTAISAAPVSSPYSDAWIVERTMTSAEVNARLISSFTDASLSIQIPGQVNEAASFFILSARSVAVADAIEGADDLFGELSDQDPIYEDPQRSALAAKAKADVLEELAQVERDFSGAPTLRGLRLSRGMSQRDLATKIGKDQAYVSRLENGSAVNPELKTLRQIRDALGCDMNALDVCLS